MPTRARAARRRDRRGRRRRALDAVIGTETSGSIIGPSRRQGPGRPAAHGRAGPRLRHRADLGVAGHRRPDGPHGLKRGAHPAVDRGPGPGSSYAGCGGLRARTIDDDHPAAAGRRAELHVGAGSRTSCAASGSARTARSPPGTPLKEAYDALVAAGAILVERPVDARPADPGAAERLRAAQDDRPVLRAPRPERPDQLAPRGDRRQPGQRARGAEVRKRQPRRLAGGRHQPRRGRVGSPTGRTCRMRKAPATRRSTT